MNARKQKQIVKVLHETLRQYAMDEGLTPEGINQGCCIDFAECVQEQLENKGIPAEIHHRDVVESALLGVEDLEVEGLDYALPHHVWVEVDGCAYDSEAPEGVASWVELPIFKRFLAKRPAMRRSILAIINQRRKHLAIVYYRVAK